MRLEQFRSRSFRFRFSKEFCNFQNSSRHSKERLSNKIRQEEILFCPPAVNL
jgi:hypothetical protein